MRAGRHRATGFTLIELLVVIVIIVIVAGVAVALFNTFFRGQGVRQAEALVRQALAQAKTLAADKRTVHFVVFQNSADGSGAVSGSMRIFQDTGTPASLPNGIYDGSDQVVPTRPFPLPRHVVFDKAPTWLGIGPSGYCSFSPTAIPSGGFAETPASSFESQLTGNNAAGDIIVRLQGRPFRMCMDVEKASGKVRRAHFLAQ